MGTESRRAFDRNCQDIKRLMDLHTAATSAGPGRKHQVEVLNKASIVLITAFWEAYCEDLAAEALQHLVEHAHDASSLPKELRKQVAKELQADKDELAIWKLSDDGWRPVLQQRLSDLQEVRNKKLNTPKTEQIDDLFMRALGVPNISRRWYWRGMTADATAKKLDKYVSLRGSIAHRGAAAKTVRKSQVTDYYELVKKLVSKTGGKVNAEMKRATDVPLW